MPINPRSERIAQHYSIKEFFRQMPNALLAWYFKTKLDFAAMKGY